MAGSTFTLYVLLHCGDVPETVYRDELFIARYVLYAIFFRRNDTCSLPFYFQFPFQIVIPLELDVHRKIIIQLRPTASKSNVLCCQNISVTYEKFSTQVSRIDKRRFIFSETQFLFARKQATVRPVLESSNFLPLDSPFYETHFDPNYSRNCTRLRRFNWTKALSNHDSTYDSVFHVRAQINAHFPRC